MVGKCQRSEVYLDRSFLAPEARAPSVRYAATWANVGLCALPEASGSSCALQRPFCVCGSLPGWAGGARWYEPRSPMRLPTSSLLPKTVAASLFAATWANVSARPADVGPEEGA
jgi:hypothetical protein